ncbi:COG4-domain-containing protein [Metschnikowia bicuspidata var. bicuspidata NRRL YB-4993]|uniref:Conserved oligomeric Golgi complex subunit 4 n=1 Tax=Metschnikowia bicuspidata var. bicuspidata NRRL YB-4993 TaxID=869754 RepID=A0A1A0HDG4_9ASCO|nr:COG4-domain-containing protein [Metschnikowia bicuspidata var. bicuspidata NRRL YB-4993]OBA21968.1 COG4-domain-containing protein [Metschnikowia bicuspidata var. bicuspidata NRRL YB-4993]
MYTVEKHKSRAPVSLLFTELSAPALHARSESLELRFHTASSAADLSHLVADIDTETAQTDAQLRHFIEAAARKHTQQISAVELTRAKLSGAITNLNDLTRVFSAANDLGHLLTSKIKALDLEIANVDNTLAFVADTQALKNNIGQIQYAIEKRNWAEAALCIHTIKHRLLPGLVGGRFASAVVPSSNIPELPGVTIDTWVAQLTDTFVALFNDAAKRRSVAEISAHFQLFPLIDQPEVGLNCYSKFICSVISDTSRTLINSATLGEIKPGIFASATASLFESVSTMLSQHTPLITKHYGEAYPQAIVYVVAKIQREIDSQIGAIADTFYDVNRVEKTLQDIKLHKFNALKKRLADFQLENAHNANVMDTDITSIVEVGDLANELAAILHHWSLYCKFITVKYFQSLPSAMAEPAKPRTEGLKLPELLASSNFETKIHNKLLPAFERLCAYYFRRSLEKAVSIEELPPLEPFLAASHECVSPEQPPISSVIEDVTLVFNSTLRNVLDSAQTSTVRQFASETLKVMQNDLINGILQKALVDNQPRYNNTLYMIEEDAATSNTATPSATRSGTPAPEPMGGFFKGASSAFGNVVGTGSAIVSAANPVAAGNSSKLMSFVIYLNTVATGQEFFQQIILNFTTNNPNYLKSNYPFGHDEEIINHIIKTELLEPFTAATGQVVKQSLLMILNQSIKNRLVLMINECFPDATEDNLILHSLATLNDPATISKFKQDWDFLIKPYKQTLHKTLYDKLLRLIVVNIANMMEKRLIAVLKKFKINELGALKLDKDLSYIINEICEDDYDLREKFVRLTQLVLLVGMDDQEYELSSYNGEEDDSGINWVLTPLERKQIRRFRF